jgi:hypothetical protein
MRIKGLHASKRFKHVIAVLCIILVVSPLYHYAFAPTVYGAQLGERSLQLSDDSISATPNYLLTFQTGSIGEIGSIRIQFCSNDPVINDPCTAPIGFSDSNAVIASQYGVTGFTISPSSTVNTLILTRNSQQTTITGAQYRFTGIVNPSVPGSYYLRIQTYATSDASGIASDYGGDAFAIANNVQISAEVPPYLIFCTGVTVTGLSCDNASGDYLDVGELSNTQASTASSQMLVATNANYGYSITVYGTTMDSGNNIIAALNNNDVSRPGIGQFGFNLRANSTPADGSDPTGPGTGEPTANYNQANSYRFDNGDVIARSTQADNLREYTASYLVNVPNTQAPGVYVTTLTYVALATF